MNTYRITLENRGGHEKKARVIAENATEAQRKAETANPGYGMVDYKLLND